jgi:SH3-like domain-containing protein
MSRFILRIRLAGFFIVFCVLYAAVIAQPVSADNPDVQISFPPPVYLISGNLTIKGSANIKGMKGYTLDYGPIQELSKPFDASNVTNWSPIKAFTAVAVQQDILGIWDTTKIADGVYAIRLTVTTLSDQLVTAVVSPIRILNHPDSGDGVAQSTTGVASSTPQITVTAKSVNVRTGDSIQYSVVGTLRKGDTAAIIGISKTGSGWFNIQLANGRKGWVSPSTVSVSGDISALTPIAPPPAPVVPTATPAPAAPAAGTQALKLTVLCNAAKANERTFVMTNPNPFQVPVSYKLSTGKSAFLFARPSGDTTIMTIDVTNSEIILTIDWGSGTASANSKSCG